MALVKPAVVDPLESGRRQGTRFYQAGGRTLARQIVIPVDPATPLRLARRGPLAEGAKTFANQLTPTEQAEWDAASKYDGRGELELIASSVSGSIAAIAPITTRAAGAVPQTPRITGIEYNNIAPTLRLAISTTDPIANLQLIAKANPPRPVSRKPDRSEIVVFRSTQVLAGLTQLIASYRARFGNQPPTRNQVFIELYHYDRSLPAAGLATQVIATDQIETDRGVVRLEGIPQPKLGTSRVIVRPLFIGIPGGTPIPITVTAPGFSIAFPATVKNNQNAAQNLVDVLGIARTGSVTITLKATSTRIVSFRLAPVVSL